MHRIALVVMATSDGERKKAERPQRHQMVRSRGLLRMFSSRVTSGKAYCRKITSTRPSEWNPPPVAFFDSCTGSEGVK